MTTQRYLYDPSDLMQVGGEFTDASELFDEEICTHESWPLPEPRKFEPKAESDWSNALRTLVEWVKQ